jgi:DNA-binding NarL/FixJ family response regulator
MNTLTADRDPSLRLVTPARADGGVDTLLAAAKSEVLVMSTQTVAATNPIGAVRRINHVNLRRGVRYRVLVPDHARTAPVLATQLAGQSLAGAATRTVAEVPTDALIIDRSLVVHPGGGIGVAVFRLPSVVTTTLELFERLWSTAAPLTPCDLPDTSELPAREEELLSLLASGFTDAAAADRLGISVRTVRRMVSDIMNRLGARSRFMAGVKAADRGWLLEKAS